MKNERKKTLMKSTPYVTLFNALSILDEWPFKVLEEDGVKGANWNWKPSNLEPVIRYVVISMRNANYITVKFTKLSTEISGKFGL